MLSQETALAIWSYDPRTGLLRWKVAAAYNIRIGDVAGCPCFEGIVLGYQYKRYRAHRVIWLMKTGKWPEHEIDHKDRNRLNNRWRNLREATHAQNAINRIYKNKSGFPGIKVHAGGKYEARLKLHGKSHYLGLFNTPEEAYAVRCNTAKRLHGEFAPR